MNNRELVLVTGGAGYIGSHTCVELLNNGYDIVVADDLRNSKEEALRRIKRITGKEFEFYRVDVADEDALEALFASHSFDAVIHFAGLKAVGESVEKPLEYYRNNLCSTMNLLDCMARHSVKRIVFSSSATVYGVPDSVPLVEGMRTGCTNPYGWTKYMSEQIIRDFAAANAEQSAVLLRYFNPIGSHESGLIGEDPKDIPNNLMPYIVKVVAGKLPHLNVFGNDYDTPDGTGVRDYIHVCDLAKGHIAALKYSRGNSGSVEINLGTGKGYSVLELVHAYEKACGVKVPYKIAPRRQGDIAVCYADPARAKKLLSWTAQLGVEEMCASCQNWLNKNPNGYEE